MGQGRQVPAGHLVGGEAEAVPGHTALKFGREEAVVAADETPRGHVGPRAERPRLLERGARLLADVVRRDSHEGLRVLLREEGVSFQVIKTFKQSNDPDFEAKKNRVLELYDIADGKARAKRGDPSVVICMDEFGPLNLLPRPGRQWAPRIVTAEKKPKRPRRRRRRATFTRTAGVRHLMAAYDLNRDKIYGHVKTKKDRTTFLEFCRYLRNLYPAEVRIAIVLDNFSPHLSTKKDTRVGDWADANNVELAYVPTNASWMNRIEAQFQALRYFTLDGTDHRSHEEQNSMIRRYIIWRNRHAHDETLRELVKRETLPDAALARPPARRRGRGRRPPRGRTGRGRRAPCWPTSLPPALRAKAPLRSRGRATTPGAARTPAAP